MLGRYFALDHVHHLLIVFESSGHSYIAIAQVHIGLVRRVFGDQIGNTVQYRLVYAIARCTGKCTRSGHVSYILAVGIRIREPGRQTRRRRGNRSRTKSIGQVAGPDHRAVGDHTTYIPHEEILHVVHFLLHLCNQ